MWIWLLVINCPFKTGVKPTVIIAHHFRPLNGLANGRNCREPGNNFGHLLYFASRSIVLQVLKNRSIMRAVIQFWSESEVWVIVSFRSFSLAKILTITCHSALRWDHRSKGLCLASVNWLNVEKLRFIALSFFPIFFLSGSLSGVWWLSKCERFQSYTSLQ